ncbi:MAG: histidine kinase, partial [Sphingobacteriia bacterium]
MFVPSIVLISLFGYLRKKIKTNIPFPEWDIYFKIGLYISIGLLVAETLSDPFQFYISMFSFCFLFGLIYILLKEKVFKPIATVVYAIIPIVVISFIEVFLKKVAPIFYKKWENVIDNAGLIGFIWLAAFLFFNNRQNKALEKSSIKVKEQEQELQLTEKLKAELEIQVVERTAALTAQKIELEHTLEELLNTQKQLIQSEKMASLGELTAGIAHEIQNPLNFVNNFSEVSVELLEELKGEREKAEGERSNELEAELLADISANLEKINHHGKRAADIVKGMLQHSRTSSGVKEPTNINALADEYLRLAYHGLRAKDKSFNATMKTEFDESIGNINIIPQDIGRVILNLITNAFYVVNEKSKQGLAGYEPTVSVSTKKEGNTIFISVKDNGNGIPQK